MSSSSRGNTALARTHSELLLEPVTSRANSWTSIPTSTRRASSNPPPRRVILNCSRQWGKSTVVAAKAVYRACAIPDPHPRGESHPNGKAANLSEKRNHFSADSK